MLPLFHLYAIIAITLAAYAISRYERLRRQVLLRQIASEFQLNYAPNDPFQLANKIIDRFPVPGAARLVVTDVVYGTRGDHFQYLFTANYTVGAIRVKKRLYRVAAYAEPLSGATNELRIPVTLANAKLEWIDQYRELAASEKKKSAEEGSFIDRGQERVMSRMPFT